MLPNKITSNIFLTRVYVCLSQLPQTHEILTRKMLDPRNTHEEKCWTHEIPMRKKFGHTKYTKDKKFGPRSHDGTMARDPRDPRWHGTTKFSTVS